MTKPQAAEPSAVGIRVRYKDELTHPMFLRLCDSTEGRISFWRGRSEIFMANLIIVPWADSHNRLSIPEMPLSEIKKGRWKCPEEVAEIHVLLDNRQKWVIRRA